MYVKKKYSTVLGWEQCSSSNTIFKKCITGEKIVTPMQITHRNSGLLVAERQPEIFEASDIT